MATESESRNLEAQPADNSGKAGKSAESSAPSDEPEFVDEADLPKRQSEADGDRWATSSEPITRSEDVEP